MSKLDSVLSKLPELASKAMPGHKFIFSMIHHAKDNTFQLTMSKDYGHNDGPMFFLGASGASTEEAAVALAKAFSAKMVNQSNEASEKLEKAQETLRSQMLTYATAALHADEMFNETVDNQLP